MISECQALRRREPSSFTREAHAETVQQAAEDSYHPFWGWM